MTWRGVYGFNDAGLIVPQDQATIRVAAPDADLLLDPVCGSGTSAAAAAGLCRRFIAIDREQAAVSTTFERLPWYVQRQTARVEWLVDRHRFLRDPAVWDCGANFVVRGDCIAVLRSMPDSFVALVVADPPFNAGRDFRNKAGEGFSDVWEWDTAAEQRLAEIEATDCTTNRYLAGKTAADRESAREALLLTVRSSLLMGAADRASYLTWAGLLLMESRRVMGSYDLHEPLVIPD